MKDPIRAAARARLKALSADERALAGAAIARRVWELPEIAGSRRLLVYASLPSEVPTDAIAREARQRGITLVYPRCLPETRQMALHRLDADHELRIGLYGIREPHSDCPLVRLEEIDAALVPGLAWDRSGGRLGRGAGYYDRLLGDPGWRGFICGLFFAAQEFDALPMSPLDVRLDAVVTEKGVWNRE
jgi:5-formyltetrahydrofolate cyclo-ligase